MAREDMTFDEVLKGRRSVRKYIESKPKRELIEDVISAASYAPNSCNLQHFSFIYIDDENLLKQLAVVATGKVNWAPALIVAVDDTRFSQKRKAGLQSLAAAIQNILLKSYEVGLGTCWMAGFINDDGVRKILNIPHYYEVAALIAIGYPDAQIDSCPTSRLTNDDVLHFNGFSKKTLELSTTLDVDKWNMEALVSYKERIGSVYASRKRISIYRADMNKEAARILSKLLLEDDFSEIDSLVDYSTYDGCFFNELNKDKNLINAFNSVLLTDYSEYFCELLSTQYPSCEIQNLSKGHQLNEPLKPTTLVTCVFKLEFYPGTKRILDKLKAISNSPVYLYVTTLDVLSPRAMLYNFSKLQRRANVYEENRLYKHGPYRYYSKKTLEKMFAEAGWEVLRTGTAGNWPVSNFRWFFLKAS